VDRRLRRLAGGDGAERDSCRFPASQRELGEAFGWVATFCMTVWPACCDRTIAYRDQGTERVMSTAIMSATMWLVVISAMLFIFMFGRRRRLLPEKA
jgi:hypothetical protein